jgi:hypothetical protein
VSAGLARALVALAAACLGEARRDWAAAMAAELEAAVADRRPLAFAGGCLVAALRQMPRAAEGRLQLAAHAIALGVIVPAAGLQLVCAIGLSSGESGLFGVTGVAGAEDPLLAHVQLRALPALLVPWVLTGIGHIQLAWRLLDRDWTRAARAGALIAAAGWTQFLFMELLLLDTPALRLLAGLLPVELLLVAGIARWQAHLFGHSDRGAMAFGV